MQMMRLLFKKRTKENSKKFLHCMLFLFNILLLLAKKDKLVCLWVMPNFFLILLFYDRYLLFQLIDSFHQQFF